MLPSSILLRSSSSFARRSSPLSITSRIYPSQHELLSQNIHRLTKHMNVIYKSSTESEKLTKAIWNDMHTMKEKEATKVLEEMKQRNNESGTLVFIGFVAGVSVGCLGSFLCIVA